MKDLDFDELDRAVNSLMSNVPKSAPPASEDKEKTLDLTSTLGNSTPPSDAIEKAATKVAVSSAPKPQSPRSMNDITPGRPATPVTMPARPQSVGTPAARRMFMDVVRPTGAVKEADTPVSRQGATIEPINSVTAPEAPAPTVQPEIKESTPVSTPSSAVEAPANEWPDPLDMQPKGAETTLPESEEPAPVDATPEVTAEPDTPPEPLTSPFLPDAKVEKRPLGGNAVNESPTPELPPSTPADTTEAPAAEDISTGELASTGDQTAEVASVTDNEDAAAQLPPTPVADGQLPEELSGDLMAVEADTTHDELKKVNDAVSPENPPEVPVATVPDSKKDTAMPGPTSIPQQYHESPSTGDKDSGSIYDTNTYHQPLTNPTKKSSKRAFILWGIVVILIGIAAGVALYVSGII